MTSPYDLRQIQTAHRSSLATSADNAEHNTFQAAVAAKVVINDAATVIVQGRSSAASQSPGGRLCWYDEDDALLFVEDEEALDTDATDTIGGAYVSRKLEYANPGAHAARWWYRTPVASGTFDLFVGVRP